MVLLLIGICKGNIGLRYDLHFAYILWFVGAVDCGEATLTKLLLECDLFFACFENMPFKFHLLYLTDANKNGRSLTLDVWIEVLIYVSEIE